MPRVILFRTTSKGDTYHPHFVSTGYAPTSLPALADTLLPAPLSDILERGSGEWEAVVITSRRAAQAWVLAARSSASGIPAAVDSTGDGADDGVEGNGGDGDGRGESTWGKYLSFRAEIDTRTMVQRPSLVPWPRGLDRPRLLVPPSRLHTPRGADGGERGGACAARPGRVSAAPTPDYERLGAE